MRGHQEDLVFKHNSWHFFQLLWINNNNNNIDNGILVASLLWPREFAARLGVSKKVSRLKIDCRCWKSSLKGSVSRRLVLAHKKVRISFRYIHPRYFFDILVSWHLCLQIFSYYIPIDLHHVSRLHLTDLPSGSPRPNLLDETLSSSSTSAALSSAASCHQQTYRKLKPRNRFELFTLHESRCVEKNMLRKCTCQIQNHADKNLTKDLRPIAACFPWSTSLEINFGRPRLQVEIKMNHGSEPAMLEHLFLSFVDQFIILLFQLHVFSCVFLHSFPQVKPIESAWGWSGLGSW